MSSFISFRRSRAFPPSTTRSSFLRRVQSGDEQAWCEFYRRYSGMIADIGRRRGLTPEEQEELSNEVLLTFWKKVDSFVYDRSRGTFRGYLAVIANFISLRLFRKRQLRENRFVEAAPEEYPGEVDPSIMEEWRNFVLEKALEELQAQVDTETWETFHMSFVQRRPVEEVSSVTRKSPNNIYVIRSRCLKRLRVILASFRQSGDSELSGHSQSSRLP